ncbi:MAG: glycosyltransferase [Firmicutes bacterium]|nr:glycosyltransferase [Bacillota bacterium]
MTVWVEDGGGLRPLGARSIGLLLGPGAEPGEWPHLLRPPIPLVDGVFPGVVPLAEAAGGRLPPPRPLRGPEAGPAFDLLLWLGRGDLPLLGNQATFLRLLAQKVRRTCLLPVHYPLPQPPAAGAAAPLAPSLLTLLVLEPRLVRPPGPEAASTGPQSAQPGPQGARRVPRPGPRASAHRPPGAPSRPPEPGPPEAPPGFVALPILATRADDAGARRCPGSAAWAVLQGAALRAAEGDLAGAIPALARLYRWLTGADPAMAALVLRNLVAATLAAGDLQSARQWLAEGQERYAGYGELELLAGALHLIQGDTRAAAAAADRALSHRESAGGVRWIPGGGHGGYRALTLRGEAFARLGNLHRAVEDWVAALGQNPDYLPALACLAAHRVHRDRLVQYGLRRLGLGRPPAIRRYLRQVWRGSVPTRDSGGQFPSSRRTLGWEGRTLGWEGPCFVHSSLARVNRELARRLAERGWDLGLWPTEPDDHPSPDAPEWQPLARAQWRWPSPCQVAVHHRWPPAFRRRGAARHVVYLPWEFGALPRSWVEALARVDEVWAYSRFVAEGVVASGIPAEKVHVVPCGFDPRVFRPQESGVPSRGAEPPEAGFRPEDGFGPGAEFRFLYIGGTIPRKGYDRAIRAFLAEFRPDEPVILTVKDFGSETFYRRISGLPEVLAAAEATRGDARRVVVDRRTLSDGELAALYRQADCLVAPYRAEGFCLPALEAMACGTPPLVPAAGPALDYCTPETAVLVPARIVPLGNRLGGEPLAGSAAGVEVEEADLRRAMRWAFEHRQELRAMGRRAAAAVRTGWTWEAAAALAHHRLEGLAEG